VSGHNNLPEARREHFLWSFCFPLYSPLQKPDIHSLLLYHCYPSQLAARRMYCESYWLKWSYFHVKWDKYNNLSMTSWILQLAPNMCLATIICLRHVGSKLWSTIFKYSLSKLLCNRQNILVKKEKKKIPNHLIIKHLYEFDRKKEKKKLIIYSPGFCFLYSPKGGWQSPMGSL